MTLTSTARRPTHVRSLLSYATSPDGVPWDVGGEVVHMRHGMFHS
jgi:hypothetical protein